MVKYITEKKNRMGKKEDKEEGGRHLVAVQDAGDSAKGCPIEGSTKVNNGIAKATENPEGMHPRTSHGQKWEERFKWSLGEVRGTFWIRVHKVPFWGVVKGNAQFKVVVISGVTEK